MNTTTDILTAARAAALFVSDVSAGDRLTGEQVEAVIRRTLRSHGGSRGCAADMAAAYGDYPETAASRMRWALGVLESNVRVAPRLRMTTIGRRPAPARTLLATAA